MNVKAFIPKHTKYLAFGNDYPYQTDQDYYTTLVIEEQDLENEHWIRHLAKLNLEKTIARKEFKNIKLYKWIEIDIVDIQIIK